MWAASQSRAFTRERERLGEGATSAHGDAAGLKERERNEGEKGGGLRGRVACKRESGRKGESPGILEIEEPGRRTRRGGER